MPFWDRTAALVGEEGVALLAQKHVAVFGLGGVGGHACEALARAGVGALSLFDADTVEETNLNRQLVALRSTLGEAKTAVMARRIADINPACETREYPVFYSAENAGDYPLEGYDYIVDAIDTVSAKLALVQKAQKAGAPVISSMGAAGRLRPECFKVADIYATSGCPLARVMRRELRKMGVERLRVVYSEEQSSVGGSMGSISFVPAAAGLVLAGAVVRDLLGIGE